MNIKITTIVIIIFSILWVIVWNNFFPKNQKIITMSMLELENKIINIVKDTTPSIVNIVINKDLTIYRNDPFNFFYQEAWSISRKVWGGTWFFITEDWIIITNKHVVDDNNADYTVILNNWEEYVATLLWISKNSDIAVIQIDIDEKITPLKFIDSYEWDNSNIKIWQFAIAAWYALAELQNSVSFGIISGINRTIEFQWEKITKLIQTDAAINPGNSGGPLINLEWKVMWINTAISWKSQWIWFAIPLSQKYIDQLLKSVQ